MVFIIINGNKVNIGQRINEDIKSLEIINIKNQVKISVNKYFILDYIDHLLSKCTCDYVLYNQVLVPIKECKENLERVKNE